MEEAAAQTPWMKAGDVLERGRWKRTVQLSWTATEASEPPEDRCLYSGKVCCRRFVVMVEEGQFWMAKGIEHVLLVVSESKSLAMV